jgi:hypothetical protein
VCYNISDFERVDDTLVEVRHENTFVNETRDSTLTLSSLLHVLLSDNYLRYAQAFSYDPIKQMNIAYLTLDSLLQKVSNEQQVFFSSNCASRWQRLRSTFTYSVNQDLSSLVVGK